MPQPGVSPLRAALEAQDLADHLAKQGLFRQSAAAFVRGLHALSLDEVSSLGPRALQARDLRVGLLEGAAESLLRCGEAEEVRALCTLAFEEDPRNMKAVSLRASASLQLQDFTLAREDLQQVLEMVPEDERAQVEMQQVEELLQLQKELETAESPESHVFGVMLEAAREDKHEANQHFSREQYGEAFGAYCRGIDRFGELKPHHLSSEARELKVALCCSAAQAALLFNDKESSGLEEALRTTQQALELEPGNVKALFRRGLVYSKTKKWTEARNDFQAVMVMDAKDSTQGQALVRRFQHQAEVELERIFEMTKRVPRQTDSGEDV
uniref:Uncharacterized protein n=1 Tax=Alexandrium catenella TaxID=2925 RepID=A0A7S1RZX2_ALECA